jgi:2-methylaconitate cis-trans-isomerase PrpF
LSVLEKIRSVAAQRIGFVDDWRKATEDSPFIPFVVFLSEPQTYVSFTTKQVISADSIDIAARQMLEQNMHEAYAGTAAVCTGTAARIPGTLVNDLVSKSIYTTELIRIGNPSGVFPINTVVKSSGDDIRLIKASFGRTARIIMEGFVYVRKSLLI